MAGALLPLSVSAREVLEECPREHLRAVYLQAVERHEVVDLAAVEVEVLKLCRERQELISEILRGEGELADLLAERADQADAAASGPDAGPLPELLPASGSPVSGAAGEGAQGTSSSGSHAAASGEPSLPPYRWFTVYGSGRELIAGVTDGVERWWVRAGDELPGGVEVLSVRARPVSVRAAAGERKWRLPGPRSRASAGVAGGEGST